MTLKDNNTPNLTKASKIGIYIYFTQSLNASLV